MNILGWIVWSFALLICIAHILLSFHSDPGVGRLARRFAVLVAIGLVVTAFTTISKLHLLWWVPTAFVLNMFIFATITRTRVGKTVKQMLERYNRQEPK